MKKILLITGYIMGGIILFLYLAFLFIVPYKVDLNVYKTDIQKIVKNNTGLNIDFDKIKVITTPFLEAGVKTDRLEVSLPDGTKLLTTDKIKGKIFLPSLLHFSIRVSQIKINNPKLNIDIKNGEQFSAVKVYEDLVNARRRDMLAHPEKYQVKDSVELPFDISKIKIIVPNVVISNYHAGINDIKSGHSLTLKGENLKLAYYDGLKAKIKTDAVLYSDDNENIKANLDINSILPKFVFAEREEEDLEAVYSVPFINPVSVYRDYDLKSDINAKLKIRKTNKSGSLKADGFVDIDNTTVKLSGLQLPKSYFKLDAKGTKAELNSELYVTESEHIDLYGVIDHGKKPYADLYVVSTKVNFENLLNIAKAYLSTIGIKNDFSNMNAGGYFNANAHIKTNFKNLESEGRIIVRNGKISDNNIGLLFDDIRANLVFDDNILKIDDTHLLINQRPLNVSGQISTDTVANLNINGDRIPVSGLYKAFAPREIKNKYNLNSGEITLDGKISGQIKNLIGFLKMDLKNLQISEKSGLFNLKNENTRIGIVKFSQMIRGRISNRGFNLNLPSIHSVLSDELLNIDINDNNIVLNPSFVKFNQRSNILINGVINDYLTTMKAKFSADGNLASSDIGIAAGDVALPYLLHQGNLPLKIQTSIDSKKVDFTAQVLADNANYITPVIMKDFVGNQTILQISAHKNGDTLKLEKTGLFSRSPAEFTKSLKANLHGAKEIVGVKAILTNLSIQPFISLFKLHIPHQLQGSIGIFPNSEFGIKGDLLAYGKPSSPIIKGNFEIRDFKMPDIFLNIRRIIADIGSYELKLSLDGIDANGSDFRVDAKTNWYLLSKMTLFDVNVFSRFIDVNKLTKMSESIVKLFPTSEPNREKLGIEPRKDFPVQIMNGNIRLRRIVLDKILIENTISKFDLVNNVIHLTNLRTNPLSGVVMGKVSMNIITQEIWAELSGKNFNIEKILAELMSMKDAISGDLNFFTVLKLKGFSQEEQLKTLKGIIDFNIKSGQLGPFGKLENFIMAENIRENQFFSSTIGSVITNLLTFNTSRFNELYGHLKVKNGIVEVSPIKSQGDVMSMYIFGKLNILDYSAEMKVRGKLASAFADGLGPLANLNPVNLVKHTPGLNVAMVKAFALFCEEVSLQEMKAIPQLADGKSAENATKFQIKLKGDTRKPLKMIKSFKWLALASEIQSAKDFVDTIPTPEPGEEGLSVEELIKLRQEQAQQAAEEARLREIEAKKPINRVKKIFGFGQYK